MSKEDLKRFGVAVSEDQNLQEELTKQGTDLAAVVSVANKHGFNFTREDLEAAIKEAKEKLSDEELDKVANAAGLSLSNLYASLVDVGAAGAVVAVGVACA